MKPNYTSTLTQTVPAHSNVWALSLRHAAGDVVRPTFLLIGGRRSGKRPGADVVQQYYK